MRARPVLEVSAVLFVLTVLVSFVRGQTVRDDLGYDFRRPAEPPARIVSLAPNITEILFALGLGDHVVGVTRYCDYPETALSLPKVGGMVDPNIETIHALNPDLIIGFRGNPLRFLNRLRELGLPIFVLDIGPDLESLFPLIEKIGRITGMDAAADRLNGSLRTRIELVRTSVTAAVDRPRVFIMLYGQGLWTCGSDSYLDSLLGLAGAVNVAGQIPKKWFLYSRERLVRDNPDDIIVLAKSEKDFAETRRWLERASFFRDLAAVRNGHVFHLDENPASRFGPRLVDVLADLARLLHAGLPGAAG